MKELFNSTKRICIFSVAMFVVFGVLDAFIPNKIVSTALDVFGDVFIFAFGYFLCMKHQNDLYESRNK